MEFLSRGKSEIFKLSWFFFLHLSEEVDLDELLQQSI